MPRNTQPSALLISQAVRLIWPGLSGKCGPAVRRKWLYAKGNEKAIKSSIAYKALVRIGAIYNLEGALKELTAEERLKERQASIKPLVEEYFAWVREICSDQTVLPMYITRE